jgi:hypothetical protein
VRSNSSLPGERSLLHAISSPAEPTEQTAIPRLSRDSRHSENFGADPDIATTTESLVSLSKMNDRGKGDLLNSRLLLSQILGTTGRNPYETSSTQVGAGDFFLQTVPESIPASLSRFLSIHADTLVSRYEAQIHANYPFLDMAVMKLTTSTFQNPATASPEIRPRGYERFLVLMACAIALVLDNRDIPFADHFETQLIFSTLGDVSRILETSKPLEEIHISLLIAFYSLYRPSLGSSWHYIGLALRTCVAQGYHTKRAVCNAKDEPAKLTFWSCFALAQECSRALGRPNMLTSIDISTVSFNVWVYCSRAMPNARSPSYIQELNMENHGSLSNGFYCRSIPNPVLRCIVSARFTAGASDTLRLSLLAPRLKNFSMKHTSWR